MRHRVTAALVGLGVVLGLTACANPFDQFVEQVIEEQTDGDVEFDTGDDGVSIETDDGSYNAGTDIDRPADFPADVPYPDGAALASATVTADVILLMFTDVDQELVDGLLDDLRAAGFEEQFSYTDENGSNTGFEGREWNVVVLWESGRANPMLSYTLQRAGS